MRLAAFMGSLFGCFTTIITHAIYGNDEALINI